MPIMIHVFNKGNETDWSVYLLRKQKVNYFFDFLYMETYITWFMNKLKYTYDLIIILPTKKIKKNPEKSTDCLTTSELNTPPPPSPQNNYMYLQKNCFENLFCGRIWNTGSLDWQTGISLSIWREGRTGCTIMWTAPSSSMRRRTSSTNSLCSMQWDTLG